MNFLRSYTFFLTSSVLFSACIETQSSKGYKAESHKAYSHPQRDVEVDSNTVFSVFSTPLPAREINPRERKLREANLRKAKANLAANPDDINFIIECGLQHAQLGLFYEAIKVYSDGLVKHPTSYELLRQRGHRYINIRQFDLAVEDLQRAAFYSRPAFNTGRSSHTIEPEEGNEMFNIYYNLGIAYYLKGNYDKAISSFKKSLTFGHSNDLLIRVTDWFYLTYRKIGNEKAASELLHSITRKMEVKNVDYLNRIMVYKGVYDPETVLEYAENDDNSLTPILAYGVGSWYLFNGSKEKGTQILERILLNRAWDSFEYIAAEVDLKNMRGIN